MEGMEGLGQGGQDMEKVHWAQDGYSKQELCVARLGSQLPRQWRRVDQYVRRNFNHRTLACNDIHYPFYVQPLASHPALTPVPAILYTMSMSSNRVVKFYCSNISQLFMSHRLDSASNFYYNIFL